MSDSKRQPQNTKQVGVLGNIWDGEFWRGTSEKFSKTGRLFALTGRREEMNQNRETSPSDGERRLVCKNISMRWFQPQLKFIYCYQKSVCHLFLWFDQFILANLFLCDSKILSFSKLSLFLVLSEIKCKCGNNKRLWPGWNFPQNNTLLSIIM